MGRGVRVLVPATTANLGSGFDCLGMALDLYNGFDFELGTDEFSASGEGKTELETSRGKLIYRAWEAAYGHVSQIAPLVKVHVESKIPVGRGLGSSATAVIAGLYAANHLGNLQLGLDEILSLATAIEGHPDNVCSALVGGLAITAIEDDQSEIHHLGLGIAEELKVVLAIPAFELSTTKARSVLPDIVSREDAIFNIGRAALFVAAWTERRWDLLGKAMEDRLHQPFRATLIPGLLDVLSAAREAGDVGAALSGAGPSVVALTLKKADAVGMAMEKAFAAHGVRCKIIKTRPAKKGAHLAGQGRDG